LITTVDGVKKKQWERVWMITYSKTQEKYIPFLTKLFGDETDGSRYFDDYTLCFEQCELLNKEILHIQN